MIDACQFRIASSTLRDYLAHGFIVALTGSKFLTGPTFSGALMIPQSVAQRFRRHPLPRALSDYASRADWPSDWDAAAVLDCVPNYGLLLRWEAALQELKAFREVPEERITQFLHAFAHAVTTRLQNDPLFAPLPVPPLDRGAIGTSNAWDRIPTIFPFLLFQPAPGTTSRRPMNREQTLRIYRLLQADMSSQAGGSETGLAALRCQLGQPVTCGERDGIAISALRICASSRLIVEAAQGDGEAVIQRALSVLDKAAWLVRIDK
ncbi:hypothetical protein AYR66_19260 [Noviherbaspirillum denitrificans]|uniref:Uncharacterized protein n=2 Tax=Noviherbaspirillum denitrificans TaxID=1968433 RepID=A0A254TFA1_9BURK|nr:hypothetical protein AYR66_19260 [Noviherbaspirillum denitrificans]